MRGVFLSFSVLWRDDKCNAPGGIAGALLFKEEDGVDVLIGPPCSGCKPAVT